MPRRVAFIMAAILIALSVVFVLSRPKPAPAPEARPYVWLVRTDELRAIALSLPRKAKSEAWVRHQDKLWYFDGADGQIVDMKRWGGGIPLLLSGPGAERRITESATDAELDSFGLSEPALTIRLTLENSDVIRIAVGDRTLDGRACYVRLDGSTDVYTVDYTWYSVLEGLVLDPPYSKTQEE